MWRVFWVVAVKLFYHQTTLRKLFKLVRKKNALCIVDEVQTGFGRVGNNFWGFEEHGIIPDIVTLGNPWEMGIPLQQ